MATIRTYEAKSKLSELLRKAQIDEEIIIAQAGVPVARLLPILGATAGSRLGPDAGAFTVPDDFSDPLLDDY